MLLKNYIFRTREQRISDSGNSTTSSGEGSTETVLKLINSGRKRSVASTTSTSSNQLSNGTIIDNIADDDLKSFDEITSSGSTGNTEIASIKNGIHRKDEQFTNSGGENLDAVSSGDDLSYQDKLHANVRRLSNTVSKC